MGIYMKKWDDFTLENRSVQFTKVNLLKDKNHMIISIDDLWNFFIYISTLKY